MKHYTARKLVQLGVSDNGRCVVRQRDRYTAAAAVTLWDDVTIPSNVRPSEGLQAFHAAIRRAYAMEARFT